MSAEGLLEAAILAVLDADAAVTEVLGEPVRLLSADYRPPYPYLEIARHQSVNLGGAGVVSSEHRVDLAVVSRDAGGQRVRQVMTAVRAALAGAMLATFLCTPPVRRVMRWALEPDMSWAFVPLRRPRNA